MTSEETARELARVGYRVHYHDGVWWKRTVLGTCSPVNPMERLQPGAARPSYFEAPLGYSHLVPSPHQGNKSWSVMLLPPQRLASFSMGSLSSSRRARVRKGLRLNRIGLIEDLERELQAMQRVNFAQAQRTGAGLPARYYQSRRAHWQRSMRREFSIAGRQWWGAWRQDTLVAYYYTYVIDDTLYLAAAKSDTAHLEACPNDALLFTVLEHARDHLDCERVVFGGVAADAPGLTDFKRRFGFEINHLPSHAAYNLALRTARRVLGGRLQRWYREGRVLLAGIR